VEVVNCGGQHTDKSRDKGRTINYPGFSITQVPINQVPLYLLTAIGLPPGGSCTVHIYTNNTQNDTKQTIHRTTQK
jgi:hypothetical protein